MASPERLTSIDDAHLETAVGGEPPKGPGEDHRVYGANGQWLYTVYNLEFILARAEERMSRRGGFDKKSGP
jgi:hypothetical protein